MRELMISEYEAGQRFDKFLAKYMELAPKSFFYKMMRKKNITLNGKKAAGNEKLEKGDTVKLFLAEETIEGFREKKKRTVHTGEKLDILYEDDLYDLRLLFLSHFSNRAGSGQFHQCNIGNSDLLPDREDCIPFSRWCWYPGID